MTTFQANKFGSGLDVVLVRAPTTRQSLLVIPGSHKSYQNTGILPVFDKLSSGQTPIYRNVHAAQSNRCPRANTGQLSIAIALFSLLLFEDLLVI